MAVTDQTKQIFSLMQSGKAFKNPLASASSALSSNISSGTSGMNTLKSNLTNPNAQTALQNAGINTTLLTSGAGALTSSASTVTSLVSYGQTSVNEFSQRMQLAEGYKSSYESLTGTSAGCSPFNSVMGVVQGIGQSAMNAYNTVMSSVNSAISALNDAIAKGLSTIQDLAAAAYAKINELITKAKEFAQKVVDMIAEEASLIADYLKTQASAFMAKYMPDWFKDSCKSAVTNNVATDELKAAAK